MDYKICRWSILDVCTGSDNSERPCGSSSETGVRKAGKHTYLHQLNNRKLLAVFDSARSEGLQLYNQIQNLTISNKILNLISTLELITTLEGPIFELL
jgi:hypothetical protein